MRQNHAKRWYRPWAGTVAVLLLAGGMVACKPTQQEAKAPAQQASSSCVSCHTDVEKLKVEAAQVPVPKGSALQAGKG